MIILGAGDFKSYKTEGMKTSIKKPVANQTFNRTEFSKEQIASLEFIGNTVNNWSNRNIKLYVHPTNPDNVISIGTTFDGGMTVIADETRLAWATALDYIVHGKVYVRD